MEIQNFCTDKYIQEYNNFIDQLENIFKDNMYIKNLKTETNEQKLHRCTMLHNSLEDEDLFEYFYKSKIKLFSSKDKNTNIVSNSLFGEVLPLKKLINNMDQQTKDVIWKYLHLFYFLIESNNKNRSDRKSKLSKVLKEKEEKFAKNIKNDLLDVELNDETNNMIDDIVKSFEKSFDKSLNDDISTSNPFESIMNITQKITEKYSNKIENGDIEIEKILGSIQNHIPGLQDIMKNVPGSTKPKETVIINEDFSTDQVDLGDKDENKSGMNMASMFKMMNSMGGKEGGKELGGIFSMISKLNNVSSEEDALKLKEEMDTYMKDSMGVDMTDFNKKMEEIIIKVKDNDDTHESDVDNDDTQNTNDPNINNDDTQNTRNLLLNNYNVNND